MLKCALDPTITRVVSDGFALPLGVRPVEPIAPKAGYIVDFEAADGDENEGDWEAWPDRYVYEATISATRLPALCRMLFSQLPERVYPILDFLGHDAYREIDPYIAYEPVGLDRFYDGVSSFAPFLYEDGLCGFGAMCDQPFIYLFIDEHKVLTLRVEADPEGKARDRIERVLQAFGLSEIENPAGADAAAHEHRTVLLAPPDRPDLRAPEEIVEALRDEWRLTLNIDTEQNLDDAGRELGMTHWRCLVRCLGEQASEEGGEEEGGEEKDAAKNEKSSPDASPEAQPHSPPAQGTPGPSKADAPAKDPKADKDDKAADDGRPGGEEPEVRMQYVEVLLEAESLGRAEEMAADEAERLAETQGKEMFVEAVVTADRVKPAEMARLLAPHGQSVDAKSEERIFLGRWLE